MRIPWAVTGAAVLVLGGCSASSDDSAGGTTPTTAAPTTDALPPECAAAPETIVFERTGASPAGSAQLPVVTAVALPVPIVPDRDQQQSTDQLRTTAAATDLLTYVLYVGDEEFPASSVSLFSDGPATPGKVRGNIALTPSSAPLRAGDTVAAGTPQFPTFTTLSTLSADIKTEAGQFTAYRGDPQGQVTILALDDQHVCVDADIAWPTTGGQLRVDGVINAVRAPRALTWFS